MPLPLGEVSPKVTERALPLPCGELPPQRLRGLQIGETKKMRLAKRLAFFRFDLCFGIIKGEQPLIRGSSASKSLRPCRAEHAAFASQTGLRLKSPTGAFTPSGHRRPFWFSFVRQKRTYPAPRFIFPHSVCAGWKTALQAAACAYRCATFPFPAPGHSPTCQRGCTARCARPPAGRL